MDASILANAPASAESGKVLVNGVEVPDVDTLGLKLERSSQGILLVDENGAKYLALPIQDIADLLAITSQASTVLGLVGTTPTAQGSSLETVNPAITTARQQLNTLIQEFTQS
ncbi:hypothetical protein NVP1166O_19 [Vibrio phage 1.166.O._10N.261.51.C7]|nr:hypothetical protein NVP1166O_19 [Vibrio phage 1.166.O._10N.261.51.C7]